MANTTKENSMETPAENKNVEVVESTTRSGARSLLENRRNAIKTIDELGLLPKQIQFILALVECQGNQTDAAMRVYKCKNKYVAMTTAWRLLSNEKIKEGYLTYLSQIAASEDAALAVTHHEMRNAAASRDRLHAADMIFKVHGTYGERGGQTNRSPNVQVVNVNMPNVDEASQLKKVIDIEAKKSSEG